VAQSSCVGRLFQEIAKNNPDRDAIVTDELSVSYSQLSDLVTAFTVRFTDFGVKQGSIVAIVTDDPLVAISTVLATSLLGAQWVEANRVLAETKPVQPTHFFKSPEAKGSKRVNFVELDMTWSAAPETLVRAPEIATPGPANDEETWLIVRATGTTGTPRYVGFTQSNAIARAHSVRDDFVEGFTRVACLFSCTAFPFITRALAALLNGCTLVTSYDFRVWQKQKVNLVTGSPSQVADLLKGVTLYPKIAQIHVGGGNMSEEICRSLLANFDHVVDLYSSAERNRCFKNIRKLVASGEIMTFGKATDAIVEIVDKNGNPVTPPELGTVRVKNAYLAGGYLNDKDAEAEAFRDGWFYTGDIGTWGKNGELVIVGHGGEIASINGLNVNLVLMDAVISSMPGVTAAAVFKNPRPSASEELIAFVATEPDADKNTIISEARTLCLANFGRQATPARILPIDEIPVNLDGTPDRRTCIEIVKARQGAHI